MFAIDVCPQAANNITDTVGRKGTIDMPIPLSSSRNLEELRELREIINDAMVSPRLNDWETKFVQDMAQRFEHYGDDTHLSPKQTATIKKIGIKIHAIG